MADPLPSRHHEESDISPRGVMWFGIGLAICAALIAGLVALMHQRLDHAAGLWPHRSVNVPPDHQAPAPALQVDPTQDLAKLRADEELRLRNHAWVDPKAGIVHIPVDHALELILQRGLPQTGTQMPLPGIPPGQPQTRSAPEQQAPKENAP